jgi:hypothetical protein
MSKLSKYKEKIVFTNINKGREYTEDWMYEKLSYDNYVQIRSDIDKFMIEAQEKCEDHTWLSERAGMFVSHYRCIKCGSYDMKSDPC